MNNFSSFLFFFCRLSKRKKKLYLFVFYLGRVTRMNKVSSCFWSEVTDGQLWCWKIHPHAFAQKQYRQMVETCRNNTTRHRQTITTLYRHWAITQVLQIFSKYEEKLVQVNHNKIHPNVFLIFKLVSSLIQKTPFHNCEIQDSYKLKTSYSSIQLPSHFSNYQTKSFCCFQGDRCHLHPTQNHRWILWSGFRTGNKWPAVVLQQKIPCLNSFWLADKSSK